MLPSMLSMTWTAAGCAGAVFSYHDEANVGGRGADKSAMGTMNRPLRLDNESVISDQPPQNLISFISGDLFNCFEAGSQCRLVFQEAVRNQVETATRAQHLRGFANEAFGSRGRLDTAQVKWRIRHYQVETL